MAQVIKQRLFRGRKVFAALLVLILLGAALLAMTVFAQGEPTLTVGSAEGYVGERVEIPVTITNHSGVAGVQFKLYYDANKVEIPMVEDEYEPGKFDPDVVRGNIFNPNNPPIIEKNLDSDEDGNYLSIASAGTSPYVKDGPFCKVGFILKESGITDLELAEVHLFNVPAEEIGYIAVNGTITVKSRQLAQVAKPVWDGDVIKWTNVENAVNYEVKLYKGGTLVDTQSVSQGAVGAQNSYNFTSKIASLSPGVFTATVQAKGDEDPWEDGPVSEASASNEKTETLGQVGKPVWAGWAITWVDVTGAEEYKVKLYRGDTEVTTKTVDPGLQTCDFSADTATAGSYTATVQAKGDGELFFDGPVSVKSEPKIRTIKLGQVGQPTWGSDGVLVWSAVENAAGYEVQLFKNGASSGVLPPTVLLTQNLLDLMRDGGAGSYTATVTALAAEGGYYEHGDASVSSAAQTIVQLTVSQPTLSDKGVAEWSDEANADGYTVQLYKGNALVEAVTVDAGDLSYDFLENIRAEGPGSYTVTVIALGTGLYLTSDESAPSDAQEVVQLAAPANPRWDAAPLLKWDNVAGATGYLVQLYKSGAEVGSAVNAVDGVAGSDLTAQIGDVAGYYTARVCAVGDGYLKLNSIYSFESPIFTKTGPLDQVTELNLSDKGVLTWVDEPDADEFVLQLYREDDSAIGGPVTVAKGVQSASFRTAMRSAGVGGYYVNIIAKGSGLFTDGTALDSNIQTVSKLNAPTNVSFSEKGISTWEKDAHATQSNVKLYLPAGHPRGQTFIRYSTTSLSKDLLADMRQYPGDYYVKVSVEDIYGLYLDSDESVASETRTVVQLPKVDKPTLDNDGVAAWTDVAGATGFTVSLYKGAVLVASETAAIGVENFDLFDEISAAGTGSYTVTITALGNGYLILDGAVSDHSDAIIASVLDQVSQLVWLVDDETGAINLSWGKVAGSTGYEVVIYNGHGDPEEIWPAEINSFVFEPKKPGFYWASVRALGGGVVFDGPDSNLTDVLVCFMRENGFNLNGLNGNGSGPYIAGGTLPVEGLWMQIKSATGIDGVMVVGPGISPAAAPAGLTAAGIFFNIQLDENLKGSSVILRAGYGHITLPERMDAASLCFYRYDAEKGWVALKSEVDTSGKVVTASVEEFSTVGIFGKVSAPPPGDEKPKEEEPKEEKPKGETPRTFGYIPFLLLGGLLLAAAGLFLYRRSKGLEGR